MRKGRDGGKKEKNGGKAGEKRKKNIMTILVAINVIASRPPERRPTGTPHARANLRCMIRVVRYLLKIEKL